MFRGRFVAAAVMAAGLVWCPASASADGPYEPNETAAMARAPITVPRIDAALETRQDEDWYLLHPQGIRQIGVLATLNAPCESSYASVTVDVLDAEGSRLPIESARLGYNVSDPKVASMAANIAFTSQAGHRYLLHVTQSSCPGAAYSLSLAPTDALGTRLAPTAPCVAAGRARGRATSKLKQYQAARRRARGARRKQLRAKLELQAQRVAQARADEKASCARAPLVGYPWE